jgi:hypothetical protein
MKYSIVCEFHWLHVKAHTWNKFGLRGKKTKDSRVYYWEAIRLFQMQKKII